MKKIMLSMSYFKNEVSIFSNKQYAICDKYCLPNFFICLIDWNN